MYSRKLGIGGEIIDDGEHGTMTEETVMQIKKNNRFFITGSNNYKYY